MKKKFVPISSIAVAVTTLVIAGLASAATTQFPPAAKVSAAVAGGNAVISWSEPLKVVAVEHYIGHGSKGGFVQQIPVPAGAKQATLVDLSKNGGRFNLKMADGTWLHLECGGNDRTVMPTFVGVGVDCSHIDPASGQKVGALVVSK